MQPSAKNKLATFIQRTTEAPPEINAHGLDSPPRNISAAAAGGAASPTSPLGPRHDKLKLGEALKVKMDFGKSSARANGNMKPPGSMPRIKQSASQHQHLEDRNGWESAPLTSLGRGLHQVDHGENGLGLQERWEEQSNMNSLFSESVPAMSQIMDQDGEDTRSDILDDRARPHRGRNGHKSTDSLPSTVGRRRSHRKSTDRPPLFNVGKNGNFLMTNNDQNNFNSSMVTHAPRNVPESTSFRQDPFASMSENTSPLPSRGVAFLHSEFPHRGSDAAKSFSHVERAAFHQDAAMKLSPENYNGITDAIHPQTFAKSVRVTSISDERPAIMPSIEDALLTDSGDDDSDALSQEDGFKPAHGNAKAPLHRLAQSDATVVFNPQKPVLPQRSQKTVTLQPEPLQISPMSRFISQKSPSRKRPHDIDYDDTALQRMNFEELQNEPFDHDPTKEVPQSPAKPPVDNLSDRLKFYGEKDESSQAQLFTQMSVRDWEDSGDWFVEQFGDIVRRMKEARQAKRKMVEQFETEVSSREEAVRLKKESMDRKLSKLKNDSHAMMKDKELDE